MKRNEFDNLDIKDQLDYINKNMAAGLSLTKTCNEIKIDRTTVRKRFTKIGYVLDTNSNQYIKGTTPNNSITKVSQEKKLPAANVQAPGNLKLLNEFGKMKTDLLELINNKDEIMEMLEYYKNNTNVIEVPELNINDIPAELQDKVSARSLKIYDAVYKLFDELCSSYTSIKKQDMTSLALLEFYKKYKK